jgi:hypothetical protein
MSLIFVNTDNSNLKDKIYSATTAGPLAAKAEAKIQKAVRMVVQKTPGFTADRTDTSRGYTIRLKVAKVTVADHKTRCELTGELVRYPETGPNKKAGDGTSVGFNFRGAGAASGTDERSLLDCVEAVVEDMALKAIPGMKEDMTRR